MIFSNHDTPLQVQPNDRRYTVITTNNKKIDYIIGIDKMDNFIENIKKERDIFLKDIIKFNFSKYKASQPLENDDKRLIVEASTPKIELLANWLKDGDMDRIIEGVEDLEHYTNKELSDIFEIETISNIEKHENIEKLKINVIDSFDMGFMNNQIATTIYKIFVNHSDTSRKIGSSLNNVLGQSYKKRINDKIPRGRKIKQIQIPF